MSPLREFSSWTLRHKEDIVIDPLRRYYLIFEGSHTEVKYFEGLNENRKLLGINSLIEIVILHKDGEIESYSHPKRLYDLINHKKEQLKRDGKYDEEIDKFVIIFDRDSYSTAEENLEFISLAGKDNILGVTNPCFELWLILHCDNSLEEHILKNKQEILENRKVSNNHTFTSHLFSNIFKMNSKSNLNFELLKNRVNIAIIQEKKLPQKNEVIAHKIGSNIGVLLEEMRQDPRDAIIK